MVSQLRSGRVFIAGGQLIRSGVSDMYDHRLFGSALDYLLVFEYEC